MNLINRNKNIYMKGIGSLYCNNNNLKNKIIFISQFHSSVCLFVEKDFEKRLENLKQSSSIDKEIILSKANEDYLREGLSDLQTKFSESDVSEEYEKIKNYFNSTSEVSSFDEAFPNYAKNSNLLESSESESKSVFYITGEISKAVKNCISSGTINGDCVEKINLSSIIRKVMSNESSDSQQISEEVGKVVRDTLQNKNIYDRIGDTTLREIYDHYTKINEKISLNINPNYKEIGFSLVGYGLLVRTYNKLVYNRPLPTGLSVEELNVIKTTRSFSRY